MNLDLVLRDQLDRLAQVLPLERPQRHVLPRLALQQPRPALRDAKQPAAPVTSTIGLLLEELRPRERARVLDRVRRAVEDRALDRPHQLVVESPEQLGLI